MNACVCLCMCECAICFFFLFLLLSWNFKFCPLCMLFKCVIRCLRKHLKNHYALLIIFSLHPFLFLFLSRSLTCTHWQLSFQLWTIWFVWLLCLTKRWRRQKRWRKIKWNNKQMLKKKCYLQLNWQTTAIVELLHTNYHSIHQLGVCTVSMRTNFCGNLHKSTDIQYFLRCSIAFHSVCIGLNVKNHSNWLQ